MRWDKIVAALLQERQHLYIASLPNKLIAVSLGKDDQRVKCGEYGDAGVALCMVNMHLVGTQTSMPTGDDDCVSDEFIGLIDRLNDWFDAGNTFEAWSSDGKHIIAYLCGSCAVFVPEDIRESVRETGKSKTWRTERGYEYTTRFDPIGDECISTIVTERPFDRDESRDWEYPIIKVGSETGLFESIGHALQAEGRERVI